MAAWSTLIRSAGQILLRNKSPSLIPALKNGTTVRLMSEIRAFQITPSRWQWEKSKDLWHFYICVAGIPIGIAIFLINIFIGPAQLEPIPEGYEPKHWEYHRNPISRFILRYIFTPEQQEYEKACHYLWAENEITKIRALEQQIKQIMLDRSDYQAWYYEPFYSGKYIRKSAQLMKDDDELYAR